MSWVTVLKASFPYVRDIATVAIPAFTSRPEKSKPDAPEASEPLAVAQTQIKELQGAAVANAESIKGLARQLEEIIQGLEHSATQLQRKMAKLISLLYVSSGVAVVALGCALWALAR
ncbi:hypothetical protein GCM10027285_16430 [Oleiagrimonas citrea]|uniref:Chemotaxis protein n=1 Tax=Oleiagrimonas citrea TaxID=1665687 RepID=A0A846ZJZ1_9GAMM|nr:hypothetical protein [Oleiagrimonas citrea]NKZ38037.1 hypothetical protein [Oleiagrimonas citrea]